MELVESLDEEVDLEQGGWSVRKKGRSLHGISGYQRLNPPPSLPPSPPSLRHHPTDAQDASDLNLDPSTPQRTHRLSQIPSPILPLYFRRRGSGRRPFSGQR